MYVYILYVHIFACILTDLMETVLGYMNFLSFDFFSLPRSVLSTVQTSIDMSNFHAHVSTQTYNMTCLALAIAWSASLLPNL